MVIALLLLSATLYLSGFVLFMEVMSDEPNPVRKWAVIICWPVIPVVGALIFERK